MPGDFQHRLHHARQEASDAGELYSEDAQDRDGAAQDNVGHEAAVPGHVAGRRARDPAQDPVMCQKAIDEKGREIVDGRRSMRGLTNDIRERTRRVVAREKATGADVLPMPFQFLAAWVGVWVARHQANQIAYLKTVNRALMERLGKKRLRFTDAERRQLAVLGKKLGRKALGELATIATPDTILRWYRELVAKKYDVSARRGPGRPRTATEIVRLLMEMATRNTGWGYTRLRGDWIERPDHGQTAARNRQPEGSLTASSSHWNARSGIPDDRPNSALAGPSWPFLTLVTQRNAAIPTLAARLRC